MMKSIKRQRVSMPSSVSSTMPSTIVNRLITTLSVGHQSSFLHDLTWSIMERSITPDEILQHEHFDCKLLNELEYVSDTWNLTKLILISSDFLEGYTVIKMLGKGVFEVIPDNEEKVTMIGKFTTSQEVEIMKSLADVEGTNHLLKYYPLEKFMIVDKPREAFSTFGQFVADERNGDKEKQLVFSRLVSILKKLNQLNIAHNCINENTVLVSNESKAVTLIEFGLAQFKDRPFNAGVTMIGINDYDRATTWAVGLLIQLAFDERTMPELARDVLDWTVVPFEYRIELEQMFALPYFASN